jgi:hypothetical protein
MRARLKGTVRGKTVALDQQVEGLEGQRVLVDLEPIDEPAMAVAETVEAWRTWVQHGPDGPIDDPLFP